MLYIEYRDARICINCGTIHDVRLEQSYGVCICPQCGEKMCVEMWRFIDTMSKKEVCHEA